MLPAALAVALLASPPASPCSAPAPGTDGYPVADVRRQVQQATVIVRARADSLGDGVGRQHEAVGGPPSSVHFTVLDVIRGDSALRHVAVAGVFGARDDFNPTPVPYRVVRPSGLRGNCYALEYRAGAEYLLVMRPVDGLLSPYTAPLAPLNEQVRGADDAWVRWVRAAARTVVISGTDATSDIVEVEVLHDTWPVDRLGGERRQAMRATLAAQRRIWQDRRPHRYVIRTFELSGCAEVSTRGWVEGEQLRERLVVRDSMIVRRDSTPVPTAFAQRCLIPWRVDDLFADVARILDDPAASISALVYDPAYGFPRSYVPDRGGRDTGGVVVVESFAPVSPPQAQASTIGALADGSEARMIPSS